MEVSPFVRVFQISRYAPRQDSRAKNKGIPDPLREEERPPVSLLANANDEALRAY
jgi:hypothetical protein